MRLLDSLFFVLGGVLFLAASSQTALAETAIDRTMEPVVLEGRILPSLTSRATSQIVGYRLTETWEQVPIQVDERVEVDFSQIYNDPETSGRTTMAYADPATFVGPDSDPMFDLDDEVVFLAGDLGQRWTSGSRPMGTNPSPRIEVRVADPLTNAEGFLYLFVATAGQEPGAGRTAVQLDFQLLLPDGARTKDYREHYGLLSGSNTEDTRITSAAYEVHFSDRWIRDETSVKVGTSTGDDLLDGNKQGYGPSTCGRSEVTFSSREGAFLTLGDGLRPVRAIRSYIGANSGVVTTREHLFYPSVEVIRTALRVHPIPGSMDTWDYSSNAIGMSYTSDNQSSPVVIDGTPETIGSGELDWEMVTGDQGTVVHSHLMITDMPGLSPSAYYQDRFDASNAQCSGDPHELGRSGPWLDDPLLNTDPFVEDQYGATYVLEQTRAVYYSGPNAAKDFGEVRHSQAINPLVATTRDVCAGDPGPIPIIIDFPGPFVHLKPAHFFDMDGFALDANDGILPDSTFDWGIFHLSGGQILGVTGARQFKGQILTQGTFLLKVRATNSAGVTGESVYWIIVD